jgi:hypothetical protein
METITLQVSESQVIQWVEQLPPGSKRKVLKLLIPHLDELESLVDYGGKRIRELCSARGIDWDGLTDDQREQLIDDLLHEA